MQKLGYKIKPRLIASSLLTGLSLFSAQSMAQERTVFVHMFEWRWNDIAQECEEVLGPKGYKAVQISPPNEVVENGIWWGRYQPISYEFGNSLGSREELETMIQRCKAVDVEIYMDSVINHMVGGGSKVPFSNDDFHHAGSINNYQDRDNVQNGALLGLNDLNTGSDYVQQKIADYMNDAHNMGVTGFRIDAAKHIAASELQGIIAKLEGNPYVFQEVIGSWGEPIQPDEYTHIASVTEFNFERTIGDKFQSGGISQLKGMESGWLPSDKAVIFVDNHDDQRQHEYSTLTYNDGAELYTLGNIFMLAYPYGYPKVMSGFKLTGSPDDFNDIRLPNGGARSGNSCDADGGDWICAHRWTAIANMVAFRNATNGQALENWWDNGDNQIAFGRGNKGFVVINRDESSLNETLPTGLPAGDYCDVISGDDCNVSISVDGSGNASFSVGPMSAVAIHVGGEPSGSPIVNISGAVRRVPLGTSVTLDGSGSRDPDGSITTYSWDSGESSAAITKILDTEGAHTFTLTVSDNEGNSSAKTVSIYAGDLPPVGNFSALNFRGTPNDWETTAMKLVADNTWEAIIDFDGLAKQRFKFDQGSDWVDSWGDANADGKLDQQSENDIYTDVSGSYKVTVNDETLAYSIEPIVTIEDMAPIADVTPAAKTIKQGETVHFSAAGSNDDKGSLSYEWSNGDTGKELSLKFDTVGSHTIKVTVTDSIGQTDSASATVEVEKRVIIEPEDSAPVAHLSPLSKTVIEGESLSFSAADSSDDKGIVSYRWSDGQSGKSITKTFNTVGAQKVSLTVTDGAGQSDTATALITVKAKPLTHDSKPKAEITPSATKVKMGESVTLSGLNSSDDEGSLSYLWSTEATTSSITLQFDSLGDKQISLLVTDSAGQTDTTEVTISVIADDTTNTTTNNNDDTSGGSLSWLGLLSLMLIGFRKQKS